MQEKNILTFYEQKITALSGQLKEIEKEYKLLSVLRLAVFVGFAIIIVILANSRMVSGIFVSAALFVVIFGTLIRKHLVKKNELEETQALLQINQDEISRLSGRLRDLPSGINYLENSHPYAPDLDVFGSNSLFQLLIRSRLFGTRDLLGQWLLQSASAEEIKMRQQAIQELKLDTDWRQSMTAGGFVSKDKQADDNSLDSFTNWLSSNLDVIDKPIWAVLQFVIPIFSLVVTLGFSLAGWPYQLFFIPILLNGFLLKFLFRPLMELTKEFENVSKILLAYERIILKIESKQFVSQRLVVLSSQLNTGGEKASKAIQTLKQLMFLHQGRMNLLYFPINILFLTDLFALRRTLNWKTKYLQKMPQWFEAIHQIDALSDLSSYAFSNPNYQFPTISQQSHALEVTNLGHPLIPLNQRINNDFSITDDGSLALITGSNMSGKSTFLRTLGVNLVLAQMGAPVCADRFEFSLMQIFTSMRTQDNLEENTSSFYAELKRIKQLLDSLDHNEPTFYMLDEILKGTNSEDRHKGAIALIDQLTDKKCVGLISTHDIQLADLSKNNPQITNYSFNSTIEDDEIIFDYKLTDGACASFNASQLMQKMGIIKKAE